jgi:hypothetical protein
MSPRPSSQSEVPTPQGARAVQIWVRARPRRCPGWLWALVALLSLGGGLGLLGWSFQLGLRLIMDPEALPTFARWPGSQAQLLSSTTTLEQVRQRAEAEQRRLGEPLGLGDTDGLMVVPVLTLEDAIAALVLVQGGEPDGRTIALVPVQPLPREEVLAPWLNHPQAPIAPPPSFPLTRLTTLATPPEPLAPGEGSWLTLEGTWQQQGITLRYGQLIYIDHRAERLDLLVPWSSPANRSPQWADLDGESPSDLIVDETIGLDPALRGWQVLAGPPPRLQAVSWVRVPVDARAQAGDYQQALRLARGGLWQAALEQLTALKDSLAKDWTLAAEAQRRLMERHAAITRQQADQDWSTPTQQILALLIDGRWETALERLEANPALTPAVINRLGVDPGRLWNRISAAAALDDPDPAVFVWGGLAIQAQQRQPNRQAGATPDWLERQALTPSVRRRLAAVLAALARAEASPAIVSAAAEAGSGPAIVAPEAGSSAAIAPTPLQALVGRARPIATPREGYAAPGHSWQAEGQWYAVDLRAVHPGPTWQRGSGALPTTDPAALWSWVEPSAQDTPQILRWTSPTTAEPSALTVRGVRVDNGRPTLLATGPVLGGEVLPPLVFSQGALRWLDSSQRQVPVAAAIAPVVAPLLFGSQPPPVDLQTALASLPQYSLDLTNDGQPERIIAWRGADLAQLSGWGLPAEGTLPKTLILSVDNRVIYSDLGLPQTLVALTNPSLAGPQGLLVYRQGDYELLTWEASAQRFE